jgi:hypothetical protein
MPSVQRRDRMVRKGTFNVTLVSGPQTVVFDTPFPDDYDVYVNTPQGVQLTSVTNKTRNGFTMALGVTLVGSIDWVAVEKVS